MIDLSRLNREFCKRHIDLYIPQFGDSLDPELRNSYLQRSAVMFVEDYTHETYNPDDELHNNLMKILSDIHMFVQEDTIPNLFWFHDIYFVLHPETFNNRETKIRDYGIDVINQMEAEMNENIINDMAKMTETVVYHQTTDICEIMIVARLALDFLMWKLSPNVYHNVTVSFFLINYLLLKSGFTFFISPYDVVDIQLAYEDFEMNNINSDQMITFLGKKILYAIDHTIERLV